MGAAEVYRKTKKTPDLFWNRFVCRPLAAVLVNAIKNTPITPNQVTLAAYAVAMLAVGLLVLWPGYLGLVTAIVVYQLSYVLDCADGMLARWRGIQSTAGHLLDFLMDELKAFAILAAVSVRLFLERDQAWLLMVGLVGLVALASGTAMTTFERRAEIAPATPAGGAPAAPSWAGRLLAIPMSVAKFLIHYPSYILYAALLGRLDLYLYPYVAVNALYMLRSLAVVTLRFGR